MDADHQRRSIWGIDRSLAILIGGALILIIAGLVAIPLANQRTPVLAAETTPEGTVQRFYQALYRGDYSTAHSYLGAETQRTVSVGEMQQALQYDLRDSQMRVGKVDLNASGATVQVYITHFGSGGIFGGSEWESNNQLLLQQEGSAWKIISGLGFLPTK